MTLKVLTPAVWDIKEQNTPTNSYRCSQYIFTLWRERNDVFWSATSFVPLEVVLQVITKVDAKEENYFIAVLFFLNTRLHFNFLSSPFKRWQIPLQGDCAGSECD